MSNLGLLVVCLALGVLLRHWGRLPEDAPQALNGFVLNVALPALVVRHLQDLAFERDLAIAALMPWLLFALGAAFFALLGRAAGWPRETTGGLMLSGGLANTSFVGLPEAVLGVLDRLAGTLVPLALVSVGLQPRLDHLGGNLGKLSAGLGFKLVLGPALVAALLVGGLGATGRVAQVIVFEAAMGPQIGGAIVAIQHGLNPRLVTSMVGIGIPLSLATAALWSLLLAGV